ncbi:MULTISPECIES: hypothetical protein [unclassified Mesorhizobium]|uniref:hypothetical protein n=1 Tax=unclassified Mesorhizobium TaxID=325217 RepID=UPI003339A5F0
MNVTKAAQRWRWLSQGIETIDVRQGIGLLSSVTEGALPHTPAIASIPGPTGDAGPVRKRGGRCCASTFDRHSLIAPNSMLLEAKSCGSDMDQGEQATAAQ